MAQFPTSAKNFTARTNGQFIDASHVQDLQDEVNAIEDGYLNGSARLNSSNSTVANLSVVGGSTFAGPVTFSSGVTFNGTIASLTATASTFATLAVTGGSTFAGTVTMSAQPRVHLQFASTLSAASGAVTAPNWDTEVYDVGGLHAANSSAVVLTSDGTYRLLAGTDFAASSAGSRIVIFLKDGTEILRVQQPGQPTNATTVQLAYESTFASGAVLVARFQQDSGSTLSIGVLNRPFFTVSRVY